MTALRERVWKVVRAKREATGLNTGVIFNVQRYSIHDGPGIRTTVFFKGCPLRCLWCHNPESQMAGPELMVWESRCISCGACVQVCPSGAAELSSAVAGSYSDRRGSPIVVKEMCSLCGDCVEVCPAKARELVGKEVTVDYVMKEVLKDRVFYEESGGGVTFSGGEPLMQPAFLRECLEGCKEEGLNTAVDTSGFAPWDSIKAVFPLTDLFLYDIKTVDDAKHRKYVGAPNALVLDNLNRLVSEGACVVARLPLVPGVNTDDSSLRDIGEFLQRTGLRRIDVLPYHDTAKEKYSRLNRQYALDNVPPASGDDLARARGILGEFGLVEANGRESP